MSGPPTPRPVPGSNSIGSFQIGVSPIGDIPAFDPWLTIVSQYANSDILTTLITDFFQYVDQTRNISDFFDLIFNVDTAQGYGLDVWGRIVGVSRTLTVTTSTFFGFAQQSPTVDDFGPGGASPFYTGTPASDNVVLTDEAFRTLIFAKALANISDGSIPSINQLLLNLFPHRGNCFSGDTEILTSRGFRKLRDMCGKSARVLSPVSGRFELAKIKSFGRQPLTEVTISYASRRGRGGSFKRIVTPNHRWMLQNGTSTESLKIGHVLMAGHSAIDADIGGWVHGFIAGDGSRDRPGCYRVRLCGQKDRRNLMRFLIAYPAATVRYPPSAKGDPIIRLKSGIDLKSVPPKTATPQYVRGFVEGLLEADGCFFSRGDDPFQFHGSEAIVRWLGDNLIYADFAPCGAPHECHAGSTNYGPRSTPLWKQHFRRTNTHKGYRVLDIQDVAPSEVYCAQEPKYHQITMRDGLRSSNCYVTDGGDMTMTYTFDFVLTPSEAAIVASSGVLPKPVGVSASVVQL